MAGLLKKKALIFGNLMILCIISLTIVRATDSEVWKVRAGTEITYEFSNARDNEETSTLFFFTTTDDVLKSIEVTKGTKFTITLTKFKTLELSMGGEYEYPSGTITVQLNSTESVTSKEFDLSSGGAGQSGAGLIWPGTSFINTVTENMTFYQELEDQGIDEDNTSTNLYSRWYEFDGKDLLTSYRNTTIRTATHQPLSSFFDIEKINVTTGCLTEFYYLRKTFDYQNYTLIREIECSYKMDNLKLGSKGSVSGFEVLVIIPIIITIYKRKNQ